MKTLDGVATGRYTVTTDAAEYLLDLDRMTLQRFPNPGVPLAADLRRDAEEIVLVAVVQCQVGQSMKILVDLEAPGVLATTRRTTLVAAIERVLAPMEESRG